MLSSTRTGLDQGTLQQAQAGSGTIQGCGSGAGPCFPHSKTSATIPVQNPPFASQILASVDLMNTVGPIPMNP